MQMDGKAVFKWAVCYFVDSCKDVVAASGYSLEDVDLLVMHHANTRIIDAAVKDLQIAPKKVIVNLDRYAKHLRSKHPAGTSRSEPARQVEKGKTRFTVRLRRQLNLGNCPPAPLIRLIACDPHARTHASKPTCQPGTPGAWREWHSWHEWHLLLGASHPSLPTWCLAPLAAPLAAVPTWCLAPLAAVPGTSRGRTSRGRPEC